MPDQNPTLDEMLAAQQSTSPAANTGQQQVATAASQDPTMAAMISEQGYVPTAQSWYTGANAEGIENGWDNDFAQAFYEGSKVAEEQGTLGKYFESKKEGEGTGVVLWDHTSDNGTEMKFGDIYIDGEKQGNVYKQFDKDTANLMLADWMFDADEKGTIYGNSDPMGALEDAVNERRTVDSEGWAAMKDRMAFDAEADKNAEVFQEGAGDEALTGVAAVGGGLLIGGTAMAATGIGIVPGAIVAGVGGLITGGTAYLNRDAIAEQAGRAYEITSMSREEFGLPAAIGTGIQQWSGVYGKAITPVTNLVEGGFDYTHGEVGDAQSEFYRVDASTGGESQVNGWWKTAHVAAAVGDAGLQFASPIGAALYTTQMVGTIGGSVGEMAFSGGNTFDYETAKFDNVFTDDSGGFDPLSAMAGIGKIGVDVVQLGFARGIMSKADNAAADVGAASLYKSGSETISNMFGRLPVIGRSAEGRAALAAGGTKDVKAGVEFITDAAGNVVSRRATIQILAPSEQLLYLGSRVSALRTATIKEGRSVTADDFYTAAKSLSAGEKSVSSVLVNAFGEGYEEAVQGVLEPWSHDHSVDFRQLWESGLYGFAMGAGMSGAAAMRSPSADDRQFALASSAYAARYGRPLSRKEWDGSNAMERRNMAALGQLEQETLRASAKTITDEQTATRTATVAGDAKLQDAIRKMQEIELKRANSNPDQATTIIPLDDSAFRADAVTSSFTQLGRNVEARLRGVLLQGQQMDAELDKLKERLAAEPANEELANEIAQAEAKLDSLELMGQMGTQLVEYLQERVAAIPVNADFAIIEAESATINDVLEAAFERQLTTFDGVNMLSAEQKLALAKVTSQVKTRDPQDANRSYQVLLPQVDPMLAFWNADNVVGISQTILPAIRGDYDGDKVRDQNQLMLDDEAFTTARAGGHFVGAGGSVNVKATDAEKELYRQIATALQMTGSGLANEAANVRIAIGQALHERYADVLDSSELDGALMAFYKALEGGYEGNARKVLVDALANLPSAGALTAFSRDRLSNEWLWVSTLVQRRLQDFQRIYASHTPRSGEISPDGAQPLFVANDGGQVVGFELRDDLGFQSNEKGIIALTRDGDIAGQATFNEGDTYLSYHLATVDPAFQGQGLSAGLRVLFEDYALRRGLTARFPDVINEGMAAGYRARPEKYREITQEGDPYPSFESTTVADTPEAEQVQAEATRIREGGRPRSADPLPMATDVRGRSPISGATTGITMANLLPAESIFRMFQQLHYSLYSSRDISAVDQGDRMALSQQVVLYEALSSMVTRSQLEEIRGKDEITTRVAVQIGLLAEDLAKQRPELSLAEAKSLISHLRVQDFTIDPDTREAVPGDGDITMTQFLLKRETEKWRDSVSEVFEVSPEMQNKYRRLIGMTMPPTQGSKGSRAANAERAFVEVWGSFQLSELLGPAAESLGQHMTVEQWVRQHSRLPMDQRKAVTNALRTDANYRDANYADMPRAPITPPYDLAMWDSAELESPTPFRAVLESMVSASRTRISVSKGEVIGEFADSSKSVSKEFRTAHSNIRRILTEYLGLDGIQHTQLTHELLEQLLTSEGQLASRVYDLIPTSATNLALPYRDGQVYVASWVYDMLIETDPDVAEMIYWRNLLLTQWDAQRISKLSVEGEHGDIADLKFSDLKRRIHQVMWELNAADDGGLLYAKFIKELTAPNQTVEKFLKWVNSDAAVLGDRAPLVAWNDDVSEFDPDKANGGWTQVLEGVELREAIRSLSKTAASIRIAEERALSANDNVTLLAVERVLAEQDGRGTATQQDHQVYNQLEQRLRESGTRRDGMGPSSMFFQVVAAARGFYGGATKKGDTPDHLDVHAAYEAWRDQFGYDVDFSRVMAELTSHTMDAVDGNISLTARSGGRTMDKDGNPVEWGQVDVRAFVRMMRDPDKIKFARTIIYPKVMERDDDGAMRPKLLTGTSLQALLDGTSYRDLYVRGDGESQFDMDMRFLAVAESEAAKHGGHFAVQRQLNDMVIARISAAEKRTLSTKDIERMTVEAMRDLAYILRKAGDVPVALDEKFNPIDEDPLTPVADKVRAERRREVNTMRFGLAEDATLSEAAFDKEYEARRTEIIEVGKKLLKEVQKKSTTEARKREILAQVKANERELADFEARFTIMRSDNFAQTVVDMFSLPDPDLDADGYAMAQQNLVDYVLSHRTMVQRSIENKSTVNRIFANLRRKDFDGQMNNISPKEWTTLSRGVIAVYIEDLMSTSAPSAALSPYPDPERTEHVKYYDHTFSYLLDAIADSGSPLLKAVRAMNRQSGRLSVQTGKDEFEMAVKTRLFKDFSLGDWTTDIPKFSIEAQEGLDSASAKPSISMHGLLARRQATISAATRRTFALPPPETASAVTLYYIQLDDKNAFSPIDVAHPTGVVQRPLTQLNNRFAQSAVATYTDAAGVEQTVDLLVDERVGRPFQTNAVAAASGLKEIHLSRLKLAVERIAREQGVDLSAIKVDVSFFHPDMKPAAPEYSNNLFFEGTSFLLDADTAQSLNETLFFFEGAINPTGQGRALDSRKLGIPGMNHVDLPTFQDVQAMEAGWEQDFIGMLLKKAKLMMSTSYGGGDLEAEYFNAVYKNLEMRHYVDHVVNGEWVRWTAQQVIEHQRNEGEPLVNARLWIPSDDVLRTMLGELGDQGVARISNPELAVDLEGVETYRGITAPMLEMFPAGADAKPLEDTELINRATMKQLRTRLQLTDSERAKYDARIAYRQGIRDEGLKQRSLLPVTLGGFNPVNLRKAFRKKARDAIRAEDIDLSLQKAGVPHIAPRNKATVKQSLNALDEVMSAMPGLSTAWVYQHSWNDAPIDALRVDGVLTQTSLNTRDSNGVEDLPGDIVLIDIDTFRGDLALAQKMVKHFADRGLIVVLGEAAGSNSMRDQLGLFLDEEMNYEPFANSRHVWRPREDTPRYRNQVARESSLVAWRGISPTSRLGILLVEDLDIGENGMWVDPNNKRLAAIAETINLVPTNAFGGFNLPTGSQVDTVIKKLLAMDTEQGRELLRNQSLSGLEGEELAGAEIDFDRAWQQLIDRITNDSSSVLPGINEWFGTGDMVPLIDYRNRIVLYRHGHQVADRDKLENMLAMPLTTTGIESENIAVYSARRNPNATVHRGKVIAWDKRQQYGLGVRLNVDLQTLGDKKILQWNGMKYLLTGKPARIKLPKGQDGKTLPLFSNGFGIDGVASMHDTVSKQATGDLLDNHQTAFWFFGSNFLPDVAKHFGVNETDARELLLAISRLPRISIEDAHRINTGGRASRAQLEFFADLSSTLGEKINTGLLANLATPETVEAQITLAMVTYLMTPGAELDAVLYSGGFGGTSVDVNAQSVAMPELFTEAFDLGSRELRLEMNRRFNAQLQKFQGTGYLLHDNFELEVRNEETGDTIRGVLQIPEVHSSGDNPAFNAMSFDENQSAAYSLHSAAMVYQSMAGTRTLLESDLKDSRGFLGKKAVQERDAQLQENGGAWRMLTGVTQEDRARLSVWRTHTPMENVYSRLMTEAMSTYRHTLSTTDPNRWSAEEIATWHKLREDIVDALGLKRSQVELVDYWARQFMGRWKDINNPTPNDETSGLKTINAAKEILDNVLSNRFPTLAGEVPLMSAHDVQLIFRANRTSKKWAPRKSLDSRKTDLVGYEDWNGFVEVALGGTILAPHLFSPINLTALDGFLQTYRLAGHSLTDLPVSLDQVRSADLMNPHNNRMLMTLSPSRQALLEEAPTMAATRTTIEELLGGQSVTERYRPDLVPDGDVAKRASARRSWAKRNNSPLAVDQSLLDLKENGIALKDHASATNGLMRNLINIRVGTALLNPMLYLSMGPEQWVRGTLDRTEKLLTGDATVGRLARVAANRGLSSFTIEELDGLKRLYENMGQHPDFKAAIYAELDFLNQAQHGQSRTNRFTEWYARKGGLAQDPTRGMSQQTLARRYVEAAMRELSADPLKYGISRRALVGALQQDPLWLAKNEPLVHQMASNALADIRSLKSTPLSLMIRGIYEPAANSDHAGINFFGNLLLKMPLIFSTYSMNVLTKITGMEGFSNMYAAFVTGRNKGFVGRVQNGIAGYDINRENDNKFNMDEVLEGVNLSSAFIRGGITHTALFTFGMMASGLGLSGEDDETKKRRKLAALYGIHTIYDPTSIETDFRNQDAIFLDWLPFGREFFAVKLEGYPEDEDTVYIAQLPWVFRQFFSPIIGMERFFETGDFNNVTRGFQDAVGSFPLINTMMWSDAVNTVHELQNLAKEQEEIGTNEALTESMWLLTNAVGTYERMLFENSFINEMYVAWDRYDRNPYILPLRDSDGDIQKDIEGNARPNDVALESFVDPETGQLMQGYQTRDASSATLHAFTENRATLAFVSSLFTGGPADSDFWRYNMPVKTKSMDVDTAGEDEAKAIITSAMQGALATGELGLENVTYEEILGKLKGDYAEAGNWDGYNQAEQEARAYYKQVQGAPPALSILDESGAEVLTKEGAFGVLYGLAKGSVQLGDESLAGIHITFEMREEIQKDWMAELKQEGIDMGLDESAAQKRVNRLWYGPTEDPSIPGIKDYLWSDQISYDKTVTYKQLNTTFVQGPDGRPWATGFRRDNLFNLSGILPLNAAWASEQSATGLDSRLNTVDLVNGMNTGLRALELVDDSSYIPTDKEIGDSIVKAIEELGNSTATPFTPFKNNSGGGYLGGGGGYSGGGGGYYSKMYAPAGGTTTYVDPLPSINTSNPYIRRASIRRERVWSEKGRLKQWQ